MSRLQDAVAVIFGGTSGIGKAIAAGFFREGAVVVPTSRSKEKVSMTVTEFARDSNPWKSCTTVDVNDEKQIVSLCDEVLEQFGRIDVMVCSAGAYLKKPAEDVSVGEWNAVIQTNLTGTFLTNRIVGAQMLKQGKGSIINIGSLGSSVALSNTVAYCASKAGVAMVTQCLSSEWCKRGVRVNAIIPGVFPTDLNRAALSDTTRVENILRRTPMGRLGEVNELVGAAVFLASDEASFVSGIALPVDGGFLAHSGF